MKRVYVFLIIILCLIIGFIVGKFVLNVFVGDSSSVDDGNSGGGIICSESTYNCDDFETLEQALEVFEECGGVDNDIHGLDRDGNGIPCENLIVID